MPFSDLLVSSRTPVGSTDQVLWQQAGNGENGPAHLTFWTDRVECEQQQHDIYLKASTVNSSDTL